MLFRPTRAFLFGFGLLLVGELGLRLCLPPHFTAAFQYGFHPDSGFEENADGTVRLVPTFARDFHAQEFSHKRSPDMLRVFFFGDSVESWDNVGSHVLSNTYPARVGKELRQRGIEAETFNLGVTAAGPLKQEVMLRKALDYEPSLVVLKVNNSNEGRDYANLERAREFLGLKPKDWLRRSYLVQTLLILKEDRLMRHCLKQDVLVLAQAPKAAGTASETASQSPLEINASLCRTLRESIALAHARGVPVILFAQAWPQLDSAGNCSFDDHGMDEVARACSGPGVEVFSLKAALAGEDPQAAFTDGIHLTQASHFRAARVLAERIATNLANLAGQVKSNPPGPRR